ncbi:MAG: haloacid dehalogenase [Dehalococcoidia bacterium]|nr:haloacid dehalogenase [Dehalococcoidia bacterium]
MPASESESLEGLVAPIAARFNAREHDARETALAATRRLVRLSANTIRAVHRGDVEDARKLLADARAAHEETNAALREHPDIYHAGFVHDAQKEYAEASATLALLTGQPLPGPADLVVEDAAYLNGLGETVGELRRALLDRLRTGRHAECEQLLQQMDDIYAVLVTVDYPDAMTGGLRRTTDQARGILERTRGDLTMAIVMREATGQMSSELES